MNLKNYLIKNLNFSEDTELPFKIYTIEFKKNQIITDFGDIERRGYFINSGIIENSIVKDGILKIIDFVFPGNFICSYTSYLLQVPSEIQTISLTDSKLEYFFREELEIALSNSIIANKIERHVSEILFLAKINRENEFLLLSAEERYKKLIKERPEIIREIPINKIAKYLGIHPESLSRIRKNIIS